ncbi:hypothetical protein ABH953_004969 [Bacillus sp. RC236]
MTLLILSVIAIVVYVLLTFEPTDQIGNRIIKLLMYQKVQFLLFVR